MAGSPRKTAPFSSYTTSRFPNGTLTQRSVDAMQSSSVVASTTTTASSDRPELTAHDVWSASEWHNRRIMDTEIAKCNTRLQTAQDALFAAQNEVIAERHARQIWKASTILLLIILALVLTLICLYIFWVHINGPEFTYLREQRLRQLNRY